MATKRVRAAELWTARVLTEHPSFDRADCGIVGQLRFDGSVQGVDHPEQSDDGVEAILAGGRGAEAVEDLLGQLLVGQHRVLGAPVEESSRVGAAVFLSRL